MLPRGSERFLVCADVGGAVLRTVIADVARIRPQRAEV